MSVVIKVATLPAGVKDVDDLLKLDGGDQAYERMIAEAKPAVSWMIDNLHQRHKLDEPQGAANGVEDLVDVLLRQHPVARFRYARELAARLDVPIEGVWESLQDAILDRERYWQAHPNEKPALPPRQPRRFPGLHRIDKYGETTFFDCPYCESADGAKASKALDLWVCVVCDGSGKASKLDAPAEEQSAGAADW